MKKWGKTIFLILLLVFLLVFGIDFYLEYLGNHQYYKQMFTSRSNRKIVLLGLISVAIPMGYILLSKKFKLKSFLLWVWIALCLFSIFHNFIKFEIVGLYAYYAPVLERIVNVMESVTDFFGIATDFRHFPDLPGEEKGLRGLFMSIFNPTLLYGLGLLIIGSIYTLGQLLAEKVLKFKQLRPQELFINFGLGLASFLLFNWILMGLGIFYGAIAWLMLIGGGVLVYFRRKALAESSELIATTFQAFTITKLNQDPRKIAFIVLIAFAVLYYLIGFQLSFIPYPTAWDANHEYMYIPKVIAQYHGVIRGNTGPASSLPYLRHSFIAFFFVLIKPIASRFWISPDTVAVNMNFLSGIFVLLFGLGVLTSIKSFFSEKYETIKKAGFILGFSALLLRLYSGMGAFLVFVDNKTDLGVMALTLLAIMGGLVAVQYITEQINSHDGHSLFNKGSVTQSEAKSPKTNTMDSSAKPQNDEESNANSLKYLIVSGIFFAFATMAKPTAFIDIVVFGVFMLARWLNAFIGAGVGVMMIGFMGILQPLNAKDFIDPMLGKWLMLIGAVITVIGIVSLVFKIFKPRKATPTSKHTKNNIIHYLKYLIIWGLSFGITLVICKTPGLVYKYHLADDLTVPNYAKGLLFSQNTIHNNQTATGALADLEQSKIQDQIAQKDLNLTYNQCKTLNFTDQELNQELPKIKVGNEDFGRYVGYGRAPFKTGDMGYYLFKIFFWKANTCYGLNADAKLLCNHADAIAKGDVNVLHKLLENIKAGNDSTTPSKAENLLQKTLTEHRENPETLKYNLEKLRQYYQDHSIYTQPGIVNIPYRYIIPLNISFNRSLQNLSSYYTDIGFIWLIMLWIVVIALGYGIVTRAKFLTSLAIATTVGRMIWILIAAGILRYGVGLVMRTIATNVVFFITLGKHIQERNNTLNRYLWLTALAVIIVFFTMQQLMNMLRIASQGGGQPFIRYKQSVGKTQQFNDQLQAEMKLTVPYTADKIYDLQFGFYDSIIEKVDQRSDDEGLIIAGTYMQYFLKKQKNVIFDTRLGKLANLSSDENVCKTYQRLKQDKNHNIKYIVLDQNIGTVVMGEGNKSLFYRFFAKVNETNKKIVQEGAISMLLKLKKYGYLDLLYTNNLGTKYAFTLPDSAFMEYFKVTNPDHIALLRAKLSVVRFFHQESDLANFVLTMFQKRFGAPAIQDLADMLGKKVDNNKVLSLVDSYLKRDPAFQEKVAQLTADEKFITLQFISLYSLGQKNPQEYSTVVSNLISNSLFGSTQVSSFEIK